MFLKVGNECAAVAPRVKPRCIYLPALQGLHERYFHSCKEGHNALTFLVITNSVQISVICVAADWYVISALCRNSVCYSVSGLSNAAVTTMIRLRFDGCSTAYRRSLRSSDVIR